MTFSSSDSSFSDQSALHPHIELKRDFASHRGHEKRSVDLHLPDGPLFERYTYLSPGIFMGLIAFIIFIATVTVGIKAVAGMGVTYTAFEKHTGPASAAAGQGKQ